MSIKKIPIAIGIKPNQVATFTNKTMSGSNNTFTNIPTSALAFNTITINGTTIPLGGSINLQVQGGSPIIDTNTTYSIKASNANSGVNLDLDAAGSGVGTDSIKFEGGGNVTVTRVDDNTIRISDAGTLGGVALTASNTASLSNKTISGLNNNLSNIPNSALANNSITINGQSVALGGSISVVGGGGTGDVTIAGNQTLLNKTISGNNNNIINLPNTSLTNPFVRINGNRVDLGTNFSVTGLGDVTTTGTQDLSNKSLLAPIIQDAKITGTLRIGTISGGNPGTAGQVLKSTGTGVQWATENQITAASLEVGSGLTGTGGNSFNGSNGITISINPSVVATLTDTQTLSNKTLSGATLSGTLTVSNGVGTTGQLLASTGTGVNWITPDAIVTTAEGLSGTTLAATVVNSSLTSVGTLTSLSVSGSTNLSGATSINGVNNLTINNGNVIFSTAGKGLDFSATSNSTGTVASEVFSDYEEGSFTPTIIGGTTTGAGTYTKQVGRYTKIGNRVFYQITVATSAHTGSGNMTIGGLPFTSLNLANNNAPASFYHTTLTLTASNILQGFVAPNSTAISLFQVVAGGGTTTAVTLDATCEISVSGSYEV